MKKMIFVLVVLMSAITSCVRFEEPMPIQKADTSTQTRSGATPTYTVLPDPYDLENVQAVYDDLGIDIELQPTHLYVRFKPQDSEQLERLERDLESNYELDLYEYPMDIDIPEGEEYIDPTIPEGELGWYYIGVPIDFAFPNDIEYEIIRECYIPEETITCYKTMVVV